MFKQFIIHRLERRAKRYLASHPEIQLVVIVGSTDKTMTRQAIGTVLAEQMRVRLHEHQKGDARLATPLAVLGIKMPTSKNPLEWLRVYKAARQKIHDPPDIDVIVQELIVKKPGDIAHYARYLHPRIAVITNITPGGDVHMTAEQSAAEYLSVGDMADFVVINREHVSSIYADYEHNPNLTTYGSSDLAEYWVEATDVYGAHGTPVSINGPQFKEAHEAHLQLVGTPAIERTAAAVAVGVQTGVAPEHIVTGLEKIRTLPGRMNPLRGLSQTLVLDDTFRAHPLNAEYGLRTLYEFDTAPQRIVVLSAFPDLGESSEKLHKQVGEWCNPDLLAWVIVVGDEAARHLAPAARGRGCQVKICRDAVEAGEFARSVTERGAVILVEGSAPDTYLEETTKILCELSEEHKLLRQGEKWRAIKDAHFSRYDSEPGE